MRLKQESMPDRNLLMYCSSEDLIGNLSPFLHKSGYEAVGVEKVEYIIDMLKERKYDVLILERYFVISSANEINEIAEYAKSLNSNIKIYIVDDARTDRDEEILKVDGYIDSLHIPQALGL